MKKLLLLLTVLCISISSYAQFSDSVQYHINIGAMGNFNRTNDATAYVFNNSLKFGIRKKSIALNFANSYIYGNQNSVLVNNDYVSTLDFNLYKTIPHFYYWGLLNYTTSYSLKINNQLQAGGGVAYNFIDKKNAKVNLSEGILYETSDVTIMDTVHETYNTFRNSLRLQARFLIKDKISFETFNIWQPSLTYGNDYIIKSNTTLGFKVKKWLTLTTSLQYNKVSRTDRENLLFNYGIIIDNYF
ncbi:MAG: DUF481 domain-containing protein [Sphingobacteriales bacterium]|nr:MAG: DUF481 domain-containing protein [Sphingobacteriales bacterium]